MQKPVPAKMLWQKPSRRPRRGRKTAGMALIAGFLMGFDVILHPKGAQLESVRDETRRKKDAQSGEPVDTSASDTDGQ
jgi:hypothetical protein